MLVCRCEMQDLAVPDLLRGEVPVCLQRLTVGATQDPAALQCAEVGEVVTGVPQDAGQHLGHR